MKITTPKQPQSEEARDWYPYYAGFTEDFVAEVLSQRAPNATRVIDPWNGSGTTTAVCAERGVGALGLDINPALTIIARGRLTPSSIAESLAPLGEEILTAAERLGPPSERPNDLLHVWMRRRAVSRLRSIQTAIHLVLEKREPKQEEPRLPESQGIAGRSESLSILACFYYAALFATTRDLLSCFRATNPTWLSLPTAPQNRIQPGPGKIHAHFRARVAYLGRRLISSKEKAEGARALVRTGSATQILEKRSSFDACITSPPYATRIDYVKSMLPELAVLGFEGEAIQQLRRTSTGTPLVRGVSTEGELQSDTGKALIEKIRRHASHGSQNYYFPWMLNYLRGLRDGLRQITRVVLPESPICVVVQDSHYKELHVDLQQIAIEMVEAQGRCLTHRSDHPVTHLMARMNPAARRHLPIRSNTESLLEFR